MFSNCIPYPYTEQKKTNVIPSANNLYYEHISQINGLHYQIIASGYESRWQYKIIDVINTDIRSYISICINKFSGIDSAENDLKKFAQDLNEHCIQENIHANFAIGFVFKKNNQSYYACCAMRCSESNINVGLIKDEVLTRTENASNEVVCSIIEVSPDDKIHGFTDSDQNIKKYTHLVIPPLAAIHPLEKKRKLTHEEIIDRSFNSKFIPHAELQELKERLKILLSHMKGRLLSSSYMIPALFNEILLCHKYGSKTQKLSDDVQACIDMIENPTGKNFDRLMDRADQKQGSPRLWERVLGVMMMSFGISITALGFTMLLCGTALLPTGVLGLPAVAGIATGAGLLVGGGAIAGVGATLFYHGRRKGTSEVFGRFAELCNEYLPTYK